MADHPAKTLFERAVLYGESRKLTIKKTLGGGYDGLVVSTDRKSAIKVFQYPELYQRELAVYLRFQERSFYFANEFEIPRLIDSDESLSVIEMSIVSPPFIVDFASVVKLDTSPQFDANSVRLKYCWAVLCFDVGVS